MTARRDGGNSRFSLERMNAMNVVCKHCGLQGSSKCPNCRNVFPSNETADDMLVSSLEFRVQTSWPKDRDDKPITTGERLIALRPMPTSDFPRIVRAIAKLTDEQIKVLCCDHQFEHKSGNNTCGFCGQTNVI